MGWTKAEAQRQHAKNRAAERYDYNVNRDEYRRLVGLIQNGASQFLERQSLRVSVHGLMLEDGRMVAVVYDAQRKNIVTFLPPEANDKYKLPGKLEPLKCSLCNGLREFMCPICKGETHRRCDRCLGHGYFPCKSCKGRGFL